MGPAARLSAPRLCARLCNISCTEPALGIEACGRRRSPVQGHSTGERIAARACTVYRKCVGVPDRDVHTGMSRPGCPDWDVELPSSSTGGAGPGARVPGVSFSGSKVYLGL